MLKKALRHGISVLLLLVAFDLGGSIYFAYNNGIALTDPAVIGFVKHGLQQSALVAFILTGSALLPDTDAVPEGNIALAALLSGLHTLVVSAAVVFGCGCIIALVLHLPLTDPYIADDAVPAAEIVAGFSAFMAAVTLIRGMKHKED